MAPQPVRVVPLLRSLSQAAWTAHWAALSEADDELQQERMSEPSHAGVPNNEDGARCAVCVGARDDEEAAALAVAGA
jgi:hypothetical protein